MPSVMIYIRQQDYDKWLAIENKPEWLHDHLQLITRPSSDFKDADYSEMSPVAVWGKDVNGKVVGQYLDEPTVIEPMHLRTQIPNSNPFEESTITPPEDVA